MRFEKKRFLLDTFPLLEWPVESSKLDNKVLLGILIYQGHHSASIHRSFLKLSQSVALLGESLQNLKWFKARSLEQAYRICQSLDSFPYSLLRHIFIWVLVFDFLSELPL